MDRFSNGGYDGRRMSNRAREAYASGERPLSKWSKADIIEELEDAHDTELPQLMRLTVAELRQHFLAYSSWHHTGALYNSTSFYIINADADVSVESVEYIIGCRQKQKTAHKETEQVDFEKADHIYSLLCSLFESGITKYKTLRGLYNSFVKSSLDIDSFIRTYEDAIRQRDAQKAAQWQALGADHRRFKAAMLFNDDIGAYLVEAYGQPINRRLSMYQLVKNSINR